MSFFLLLLDNLVCDCFRLEAGVDKSLDADDSALDLAVFEACDTLLVVLALDAVLDVLVLDCALVELAFDDVLVFGGTDDDSDNLLNTSNPAARPEAKSDEYLGFS